MISERIKQEYQNYKTNGGYLYSSNDQGRGCVGRSLSFHRVQNL